MSAPRVQAGGPVRGHERQPAAGSASERARLIALFALIAVAAVAVPPLIAPDHGADAPVNGLPLAATSSAVTPGASSSTAAATPSATAAFPSVSIEAEDPRNQLTGGPGVISCSSCEGGQRVGYLAGEGRIGVRLEVPVAGTRSVTVYYESDGPRTIKVDVNGVPRVTRSVTGPDWDVPRTFQFTTEVPAGTLALTFYNDQGPAPDLDRVVVS